MLRNRYLRFSLLFGLLAAVLVVIYFFCFYIIGENAIRWMSRFDILLVLIVMAGAMFFYRDRRNEGRLHFWEAVTIGFFVNLIGTIVSTLVIFLFISFLEPAVFARHLAEMRELVVRTSQQMTEAFGKDAVPDTLRGLSETRPIHIAVDIFLKKFMVCLLASGFIGAILRKQ